MASCLGVKVFFILKTSDKEDFVSDGVFTPPETLVALISKLGGT
jgi:hypothetical protein